MSIETSDFHTHPVDKDRFFVSFSISDTVNKKSWMETFAYDGEWFYVGGGSAYYNIQEVKTNSRKANGVSYYFQPELMAIDHIFKHNRLPVSTVIECLDINDVLKHILRDHKLNNILNVHIS